MNVRRPSLLLAAATAAAALLTTVVAAVPAGAADDFGSHVVGCAQDMGFTGEHNPGMHRGRTGWDPTHVC